MSRDVAAALVNTGFSGVTRDDREVRGIAGWRIFCEQGGRDVAIETLEALFADRLDLLYAVVFVEGQGHYPNVAMGILQAQAVVDVIIRHSVSARVTSFARAILKRLGRSASYRDGVMIKCGAGREEVCGLPLDDWLQVMLGWRLFGFGRRGERLTPLAAPGAVIPPAAPAGPGLRWISHDYTEVREAQVADETEEEVKRYGRTLQRSAAGSMATADEGNGEEDEVGGKPAAVVQPLRKGGRGHGRGGKTR